MIPLRLKMIDFMTHRESEIDFSKFSSALIIGQKDGNELISNAAGKSTIFRAIRYVLFNAYDTPTIDRIIRRGQKKCVVEFEFKSNDFEYKIFRARSKGSSTLEFFKKENNTWIPYSSNTNSNLEEELQKILKLNDNSFLNTYFFSQKDYIHGFLSAKNPKERLEVIKNALLLHIYTKYEEITKQKITELNKETAVINAKIDALDNPLKQKEILFEKLNTTEKILAAKNNEKINLTDKLVSLNSELSFLESSFSKEDELLNNEVKQLNLEVKNIISKLDLTFKEIELKNSLIQKLKKEISSYEEQISFFSTEKDLILKTPFFDKEEISSSIKELSEKETELKAKIISNNSQIEKLKNPLPTDSICPQCKQAITDEYKNTHNKSVSDQITFFVKENEVFNKSLNEIYNKKSDLNNKLTKNDERNKKLLSLDKKINEIKLCISKNEMQISSSNDILQKLNTDKISLSSSNDSLSEKINNISSKLEKSLDINISEKISNVKKQINEIELNINALNQSIQVGLNNIAIINNKILENEENIKKYNSFILQKEDLQKRIDDYQIVSKGFSSVGVPNRIIYNILDNFQDKTNDWLGKIMPTLQVQFLTSKNKKGKEEDTFDLKFFENSLELDVSELSGGQEFAIRLALKLGLKDIVENGVPIFKLICLDEVDERLDDSSSAAVLSAIKELEKEYKILLITHKNSLKEKFKNIILVNNNATTGATVKVLSL